LIEESTDVRKRGDLMNDKETVLISGVAGVTGRETARCLLERGYQVIGFDNFFASHPRSIDWLQRHSAFTFYNFDLNDQERMRDLEGRLAHLTGISVIHCAAVVHTRHFYFPSETFRTNVIGTESLISMAVRLNARKFINCSSSEVYSMRSYCEGGVTEDAPILLATAEQTQRTSYATGKLITEFLLREQFERKALLGCSVRFANIFSELEWSSEHIIPFVIESFRRYGQVQLLENARLAQRTFLHSRDSAAALVALLETESALDGSVYNVGSDEEISIVELTRKIARLLGLETPKITYSGSRSADPSRRLLNTTKIRSRTQWQPTIDLDHGLQLCVQAKRQLDNE